MSEIPSLRQVTRQLIENELGASHMSNELADAAVSMFTRLLSTLSVVLGQSGSAALFRRSLKLAEGTIPFYEQVRTASHDTLFDVLNAAMLQQPPEVIREGSEALLTAYIELLAAFIGERLTWQLLQEVWPALRASIPQESEQ